MHHRHPLVHGRSGQFRTGPSVGLQRPGREKPRWQHLEQAPSGVPARSPLEHSTSWSWPRRLMAGPGFRSARAMRPAAPALLSARAGAVKVRSIFHVQDCFMRCISASAPNRGGASGFFDKSARTSTPTYRRGRGLCWRRRRARRPHPQPKSKTVSYASSGATSFQEPPATVQQLGGWRHSPRARQHLQAPVGRQVTAPAAVQPARNQPDEIARLVYRTSLPRP
jgi:hypothetical protein